MQINKQQIGIIPKSLKFKEYSMNPEEKSIILIRILATILAGSNEGFMKMFVIIPKTKI